jgi:hypothetical protein
MLTYEMNYTLLLYYKLTLSKYNINNTICKNGSLYIRRVVFVLPGFPYYSLPGKTILLCVHSVEVVISVCEHYLLLNQTALGYFTYSEKISMLITLLFNFEQFFLSNSREM